MVTPTKIEMFLARGAPNRVDEAIDELHYALNQRGDGIWAKYINQITPIRDDLQKEIGVIENTLNIPEEERD